MRKIYTSIDIGTDEIKALTMECYNDKFNVLATAKVKTKGVKKGLIVDATLISSSLKKVIKELESKLGTKVEQVLAIVPSNNLDINIGMGEVEIHTENNIIDGEAIFNSLQKSLKDKVLKNMEVVSIMPIEYKIDKLPQPYKNILYFRYIKGYNLTEVSNEIDVEYDYARKLHGIALVRYAKIGEEND